MPSHAAAKVVTRQGLVAGDTLASGVRVFCGLRYAAAPTGEHRWAAPRPPESWTDERPATVFGAVALQPSRRTGGRFPSAPERQSEDCLFLNVWTDAEPGEARPVIVWLHLGGFQYGSGSSPLYDGEAWAQAGAVFVTLNFRLGPTGFLAHPLLQEDGTPAGNYGLLDQIAALRWVSDNIAGFGGDSGCVTLMGASSGATSISLLMACPAARGLFHRAIAESGGAFGPMGEHAGVGDAWLDAGAAGRAGERWALARGAVGRAALRALPPEALCDVPTGSEQLSFAVSRPMIDGVLLPETAFDAFAGGRQCPVPLLVGSAADEGAASLMAAADRASFLAWARRDLGDDLDTFLTLYPARTDDQARAASQRSNGHRLFTWQAWAWACQHARAGHPVYAYRFEARLPRQAGTAGGSTTTPAFHGASVFYSFDRFALCPHWDWTPEDRDLARTLRTAWLAFARTGRPLAPALAEWLPFDPDRPKVMRLATEAVLADPAERDVLAFWDAHYARRRLTRTGP